MPNNDSVLIDGIVDERIALELPSKKRGEVFELFAAEQIVKDFNIVISDVLNGVMDGRDDGGIDFAYIFVNGHLLNDPALFFWPRSNVEIEVFIITSKHHDTFKQAPLDNIYSSICELFNFRLTPNEFKGSYSRKLIDYREKLKFAYKKTAQNLTSLYVNYFYASRGDSSIVGHSISARADQIVQMTKESFSNCISNFMFFGSSELINLNRKRKTMALELPFKQCFSSGERYVILSKIDDYYGFITENGNKLRRYLFDANVRDYMGLNRVNEDIKATLENEDSPDFWWLNNGITILARGAKVIGDSIQVDDIQIVNGLQTSESIYNYFKAGGNDRKGRFILIKIIVTDDEIIRDQIIQATNNQTPVEIASLHASDKIQKNIEDILLKQDYYYERRTNHYNIQHYDKNRIISPLYLASGYLGLVLKQPFAASRLKNKFVRNTFQYEQIFSEKNDIRLWPKIVEILKATDKNLELFRGRTKKSTENFLKRWRNIVSIIAISFLEKDFNYTTSFLISLDITRLSEDLYKEIWNFILKYDKEPYLSKKWTNKATIETLIERAESELGIQNSVTIINRTNPIVVEKQKVISSTDFIEAVNNILPDQPWKPGIHLEIARKLDCSTKEVSNAINILVMRGKRYRQKSGVVYDKDGNIIMIDKDRVDEKTMLLKSEF